jgi:hypothetical protein
LLVVLCARIISLATDVESDLALAPFVAAAEAAATGSPIATRTVNANTDFVMISLFLFFAEESPATLYDAR